MACSRSASGTVGPSGTGTSLSGSTETVGGVRREVVAGSGVVPICGEFAVGVDLAEIETSGADSCGAFVTRFTDTVSRRPSRSIVMVSPSGAAFMTL